MTDDMNEKLLQEYLEGRSPVSDAYQAAEKSGPPLELDRAVLAEARAAARAGRDIGSPRWQAWLMPVSLAATVALCIALVAEVVVLDPLLKTTDSPQTFSDIFEAEADAPVASPVTAGRQSSAQEMRDQKPQRPADAMEAKRERVGALDEVARGAEMAAEEAPGKASFDQARENLNAPEPTSDRRASEKARAVQKDDVGEATSFSTSVQPATVAVELARPAEDSDQSTSESNLFDEGVSSGGPLGGTAGEVPDEVTVTVLPASDRAAWDRAAWPAADVWLTGIRVLLNQGEQERAEAELEKFLEIYPDYPIGDLVQGTDED
jgi:hypothetical protein